MVLDKLDYCATLNNLATVRDHPNFKWVLGAAAAPPGTAADFQTLGHLHSPSPLTQPFSPLLLCRFIKGDIQSTDLIVHVMEHEQIDTEMHFAAQTHVDNSFGNSMAFTMNNT